LPEQHWSLPAQASPFGWPQATPPVPQKPLSLPMQTLVGAPGAGLQQPSGHAAGVQTQFPATQVTPGGPIWQLRQGPPLTPQVVSLVG
jgi:hypothetical protein